MKMGDKKARANCVVFDSFRHITTRFIVKQQWRAGGQLTPSNFKDFGYQSMTIWLWLHGCVSMYVVVKNVKDRKDNAFKKVDL